MIGTTFGDFTIAKLIGSGSMGTVYLAAQNSLEREIALKVIDGTSSADLLQRFIREAKIAAAIQHPNVISIYSVGRHENFAYIAMEYVSGASLATQVTENRLPETTVWEIALQLCQGLQSALKHSIIHRDIKPANILLTPQNLAKITDFGLSKRIGDQNQLTHPGTILGTPNYMSPEQGAGEDIDFKSDIYSLGATLYQLLTQKLLYTGKTVVDVLFKHKFEPAIHPQRYVDSLREETAFILAKMLHKNPKKRYRSYGDLIIDITALLNNEPLAFAGDKDAEELYQYTTKSQADTKRMKFITSLKGMINNVFKPRPQESQTLIFVSGLSATGVEKHVKKYKSLKLHVVSSLAELTSYLQHQMAVVILDSNFLNLQIIDFFNTLKYKFPQTPLFIQGLVHAGIMDIGDSNILTLPYAGDEAKLGALTKFPLETYFRAQHLKLALIVFLARKHKWTLTLRVEYNAPQCGTIVWQHGKIVAAQCDDLQGKQALHFLLVNAAGWRRVHSNVETIYSQQIATGDTLQSVPLHNLLLCVELEQKSCRINIDSDAKQQGIIDCQNGRIVDAGYGSFSGEEALLEMLCQEEATISLGTLPPHPIEAAITRDLFDLIYEMNERKMREQQATYQLEVQPEEPLPIQHPPPQIARSTCDIFINYLVEQSILQPEQLVRVRELQASVTPKLGELAIHEGLMIDDQVSKVLKVQKRIKKNFGDLAIQMGFLSCEQVTVLLDLQHQRHITLFEIIWRENILPKTVLKKELEEFTNID